MTTLDKSLVKTYAQSSILPHKGYLELLELQVIFYRNQYGLSLIDSISQGTCDRKRNTTDDDAQTSFYRARITATLGMSMET